MLAEQLKKNRITVEENNIVSVTINTSKSKLLFTLSTVIQNAIDSLSETHTTDKKIKLFINQYNDLITIEIHDNGIGILPENHRKIFDERYTTKKGHYGLNLYTTSNYVYEMKGSISICNSIFGVGVAFKINFDLI